MLRVSFLGYFLLDYPIKSDERSYAFYEGAHTPCPPQPTKRRNAVLSQPALYHPYCFS